MPAGGAGGGAGCSAGAIVTGGVSTGASGEAFSTVTGSGGVSCASNVPWNDEGFVSAKPFIVNPKIEKKNRIEKIIKDKIITGTFFVRLIFNKPPSG